MPLDFANNRRWPPSPSNTDEHFTVHGLFYQRDLFRRRNLPW
jgi:hypothetical protein